MAKVIHSMIRVLDLDKSMRFYADVLGMEASHRLDFPDFSLGTCATRTTTSKSSSRSTRAAKSPTPTAPAMATSPAWCRTSRRFVPNCCRKAMIRRR